MAKNKKEEKALISSEEEDRIRNFVKDEPLPNIDVPAERLDIPSVKPVETSLNQAPIVNDIPNTQVPALPDISNMNGVPVTTGVPVDRGLYKNAVSPNETTLDQAPTLSNFPNTQAIETGSGAPVQTDRGADVYKQPPLSFLGLPAENPNTSPLSANNYLKQQILAGETRKDITASEARNLSQEELQVANIQREAEAEQRRMVFGNPEELLKANEELQKLSPYDPIPPELQARLQQNAGSKTLLDRAMAESAKNDEDLRSQIRKAQSEKIDPSRWWNNKGTEGKILAGIGMVLAGAGGGLTGRGGNLAVDIMNKAIDDDINSQRHHIDNNWKAISDAHEINQSAFTKQLHQQTWENNFRTSALENVKLKLGQIAASTKSETVKNNALDAIQTLSDQQMQHRYDSYRMSVQEAQAELNRKRMLSKDADKDVQELIKEKGVSYNDAVDAVYNRQRYQELIGSGMAPPEQAERAFLRLQYQQEYNMMTAKNGTLGKPAYTPEAAKNELDNNPKYKKILKETGVVVPDNSGAEHPKDLEARTVDVQIAPGKTERRMAASKEEANLYREKTGAAQQWEANTEELKKLYDKSVKDGLSNEDIAKWQSIRSDMPAIYGVMKEGSKRLPNESEKELILEKIIGNPPNQGLAGLNPWQKSGSTSLTTSTDLESKVRARMDRLNTISGEARKAANLSITDKSKMETQTEQSSTPSSMGRDGKTYGTPVKR